MTTSTGTVLVLAGALGLAACVRTAGTLDGGSGTSFAPVNCAAEEVGLEFFPRDIVNFEELNFMYGYFDGTSFAHAEGALPGAPIGYRPPAVPVNRCMTDAPTSSTNVLHITGGPFLGWGGGVGVAMEHLSQDEAVCARGSPYLAYCPPPSAGDAVSHAALDLSQWDGVSVWARRGPASQPLLRMLVGNKDTDDDISYWSYDVDPTLPRNCERVKECACTYQNLGCAFYDESTPLVRPGGGYYCGEPGAAPGPAVMAPTSSTLGATNTCNVTRCDDAYAAYPNGRPNATPPPPGSPANPGDPQFKDRPCTPYAFRNGLQSSYCFNPGVDPPPAESDQQCGDHWTAPLHLTTDWQLFKVPFTTMFQQGFAKRSPSFDLKSVSVVRLTWDAGNVDYWIDDLRFYRVRR